MTPELLRAATGCTAVNAAIYAPLLTVAFERYQITTSARQAAFLAQVGHESGAFRWTREIWGPTPAQQRYEGRADLGNTEPGDGLRFCGRGLIQTTGRFNYRRLTLRLKSRLGTDTPDFESTPDLLEQPKWAALSAADYWDMRGLNELADDGQFDVITRKVNGGMNGAADRRARYAVAVRALKVHQVYTSPEPVQKTPENAHVKEAPVAPLIAAAGKSLLAGLAKTLISGFMPLATEKIEREIGRHTDRPEVVEQITDAVITAAKVATGLEDPIEAVAEARKDPQVLAQVEASVLDKLTSMAPLLTQLDAMDRQRFADEEGSRAAAHARNQTDWDMTPVLVYGALALVGSLVLLVGGISVYQVVASDKGLTTEVWAAVTGLIGFAAGIGSTVYAFRFGTTRGSGAKDMLIRELTTTGRTP